MAGVIQAQALAGHTTDAELASAVKAHLASGDLGSARAQYGELVERHQRRASRIAFNYLRDAADADEVVQDAFVKAYGHLGTFREELPFQVWFTRILVNSCLDRIKARGRRDRWVVRVLDASNADRTTVVEAAGSDPSPEQLLLAHEARQGVLRALDSLPERQRTIFVLTHFEGWTPREVSALTGLQESTVRVHLFRAVRRLRTLLTDAGFSARVYR